MKKIFKVSGYIFLFICFINLLLYFLPYVFPSIGTEYTKDFDLEAFKSIKIGTPKKQVDSLLGRPFFQLDDNTDTDSIKLHYWYSKENSPVFLYDRVEILFYEEKVIEKRRFLAP